MYKIDFPVIGQPSKYAFANAVLGKLEDEMLTQSHFDQLRVADSMREFLRMMSDTSYAGYFEGEFDINDVVEKEIIRTKEELYEILPEEDYPFFDIFFRKYDYNNLKMILKSQILGKPVPEEYLSGAGNIKSVELLSYFRDNKMEELPFPIDYEALDSQVRKENELSIIDAVLDRAYYGEYLEMAEKMGDDFFIDFVRTQIDLINILIFIRSIRAGITPAHFLIEGGYIDMDEFEKHFGDSPDTLLTADEFYLYRSIIKNGLIALKERDSFSELETAIRNYLVSILAEVWNYFFTIKPFIAYLLAKEHEVHLVKKMFIHVKNKLAFGAEREKVYV